MISMGMKQAWFFCLFCHWSYGHCLTFILTSSSGRKLLIYFFVSFNLLRKKIYPEKNLLQNPLSQRFPAVICFNPVKNKSTIKLQIRTRIQMKLSVTKNYNNLSSLALAHSKWWEWPRSWPRWWNRLSERSHRNHMPVFTLSLLHFINFFFAPHTVLAQSQQRKERRRHHRGKIHICSSVFWHL